MAVYSHPHLPPASPPLQPEVNFDPPKYVALTLILPTLVGRQMANYVVGIG